MNQKINQYQNRLFNKLFATLPSINKLNNITNDLNLDEEIAHIYSFRTRDFWFAKGEKEGKYIFIFGCKNKPLKDITINDNALIIDFDEDEQFNDNSLGIFSIKNSEIHVLINYDILLKRYPYFNTSDFKKFSFKSFDNKIKLNLIDLGSINNDFIENLEKFIKLSSEIKRPEIEDTDKTSSDICEICSKNKNNFPIDSNLKNLKNIKPELCGKCIEKIVVSEFYIKILPLINTNDTKDLSIVKEKFANDKLFDYGIKLLEKYDILSYIGVKKLYFTLDKNPYLVQKYLKYSDKHNLLIDNIFAPTNKAPKENKTVNMNTTDLTRETKSKMNLFLNALKSGKTHEQAYKIAKINESKVENWYNFGRKGEENYIPFYNNYKKLRPEYIERMDKMEIFFENLKKDSDLENALKKSDLSLEKVRAWYNLGEKGDEEYKDFYLACKILLPTGIPKKESKKIVDNNELMNEFIALIDDGKTNEEAINTLKIPKFKVKNWINQGKLGNKKYVEFYNAYMIQINKQTELQKAKKREKELEKQKREEIKLQKIKELEQNEYNKRKIDPKEKIETNDTNTGGKKCKICGRKLNKKSTKDICRRCARKQYASKIIFKLLQAIEPEQQFKKDDLKILGLQKIQITDYIWTLQEFNLINKDNNKIQLKSKDILDEFIKESGLEVDKIEIKTKNVKLNKTCRKCGETFEISQFYTSNESDDGYEDVCKDCKKLINTATYLKEIIEYVDFETNFTEDDLRPHFNNPIELQAKVWSLLENDLAVNNFEENNYTLTNKKTADEFLDKYYEESDEKVETTQPSNSSKPLNKNEQMKIILKAVSEGKSRKEAAELANVPLYKITHWYNEGRQGYGNENANFYKQLNHIEKNNIKNQKDLKEKMETVIIELKSGKSISEVNAANEVEIKEWIHKGEQNKSPYNEFLEKYDNIIVNNRENDLNEYETHEINRKIFLENLKTGKSKEESAKNADIDLTIVHEWYNKGKNNEEPYVSFYERYIEVKNNNEVVKIPKIEKKDSFGNTSTISKMNQIIEELIKGKTEKEAIDNAKVSEATYKYWLNRGKQKFGEIYTQFNQYITEIKNGKYSNIAIANDEDASSKTLDDKYNTGIYTPLSKDHVSKFNPNMNNKSGIAWVSKVGNQWYYQRQKNGKQVKISAQDIHKLYEKVIRNNQIWGIIDLEKARKTIEGDIEDKKEEPEIINDEKPIEQNTDIFAPLPEEYTSTFNPSQKNRTGIAWVNKVGNKWVYQRQVNGKPIRFSDPNINNLHQIILDNNQIWGIVDYDKAKPIINNNELIIEEETESPEISKPQTDSSVSVTYIEKPQNEIDILIQGTIKNKQLMYVLSRFVLFEENIKRIITTSVNNNIDIFIELEMNKYLIKTFEEKIEDLNWNISKLF